MREQNKKEKLKQMRTKLLGWFWASDIQVVFVLCLSVCVCVIFPLVSHLVIVVYLFFLVFFLCLSAMLQKQSAVVMKKHR